jgi:hypothetical protein
MEDSAFTVETAVDTMCFHQRERTIAGARFIPVSHGYSKVSRVHRVSLPVDLAERALDHCERLARPIRR